MSQSFYFGYYDTTILYFHIDSCALIPSEFTNNPLRYDNHVLTSYWIDFYG